MKGMILIRRAMDVLLREGPGSFLGKTRRILSNRLRPQGPAEHLLILESFHPSVSGLTMVDVGAATGNTLAAFVEAGWRVHAFEPDPANRAVLERLFHMTETVHIDSRALSSTSGREVVFYTSTQSPGISSLVPFHDSHRPSERVNVTTLADYVQEAGIDRIDFLKIDTEGSDFQVLQGHDWQAVQPHVVMCEFDDRKTRRLGTDWRQLAEFLERNGYNILVSEWRPLDDYGGGHRWLSYHRFPCSLQDPQGWGNLIGAVDPAQLAHIEAGLRQFAERHQPAAPY